MYRTVIRRMTLGMIALIFFHLGYTQALAASARIEDVMVMELEGRSRLAIELSKGAPYSTRFDRKNKTLTIRFTDVRTPKFVKELEYSDKLIDSIKASKDKETGDSIFRIVFKEPDILFYRGGAPGGRNLTFDFRKETKTIKITGMTKAEFVKRLTPPPEETTGGETAEQPDEETVVANATSVDEKTAPPAPVEPEQTVETVAVVVEPTKEDIAKRFTEVDESYPSLERVSGRKAFIELMVQMRQEDEEGDLKSIRLAERFLRKYPDSVYSERVAYSRADAFYQLAKRNSVYLQGAMSAYNEAIARFPASALVQQAMIRKGRLNQQQRFHIEALSEFGGLIRQFPKGKYVVTAMLERADIHLQRKRYMTAYNELERILVLFPNRREVRDVKYMIAESFYNRNKIELADKIFAEAIKTWPTFPKIHPALFMKIADTHYRVGQKEAAKIDWLTILNLFPVSREGRAAMLRLGDYYVETDSRIEAVQLYENVIRRFPDDDTAALASLRLASIGAEYPHLLKQSRIFDYSAFAEPIKTFDAVFEQDPEKFGEESLLRKGRAFTVQKRYLSSIVAYKELLRLYPSARMSDEVFELVRQNFFKLIDTYHAQDGFFMALLTYYNNFDPFLREIDDPSILMKIADSYDAMTLYSRAVDYYEQAARADESRQNMPYTAFRIARSTLLSGDRPAAIAMLRSYLDRYPGNEFTTAIHYYLGTALRDEGNPAMAATEWRIALEEKQGNALTSQTAYLLGELYKKQGDHSLAADAFNLSIDSYRPSIDTGVESSHIKDSYYQLAESSYLSGDYPAVIAGAAQFADRYPEDERIAWMEYLTSSSLGKINKDEAAAAGLRDISKTGSGSLLERVAAARLDTVEWKQKNPGLFPN